MLNLFVTFDEKKPVCESLEEPIGSRSVLAAHGFVLFLVVFVSELSTVLFLCLHY